MRHNFVSTRKVIGILAGKKLLRIYLGATIFKDGSRGDDDSTSYKYTRFQEEREKKERRVRRAQVKVARETLEGSQD